MKRHHRQRSRFRVVVCVSLVLTVALSLYLVLLSKSNKGFGRDGQREQPVLGVGIETKEESTVDKSHPPGLAGSLPVYIVYATPWFGNLRRGKEDEFFKKFGADNCPLPEELGVATPVQPWCLFTHNRSKIQQSSALVFHVPSFRQTALPARKPHQPWVVDTMESPMNYRMMQSGTTLLFNYSMSYRLDADFPIPYFSPLNIVNDLSRPLPPGAFIQRRSLAAGQAPILWLASNCGASNHRTEFVAELRKHIPVDCLGNCLRNGPKASRDSSVNLMSKYKFYLALENSNCKDYVTEKLFRALQAGVVPIVSGPFDQDKPDLGYRSFAPSRKSLIFADDFGHPRDLARFVADVERNETEWLSYLEYRGDPSKFPREFSDTWGKRQYDWGHCGVCRNAARRIMGMDLSKPHVEPDITCKEGHRMGFNFKQ